MILDAKDIMEVLNEAIDAYYTEGMYLNPGDQRFAQVWAEREMVKRFLKDLESFLEWGYEGE